MNNTINHMNISGRGIAEAIVFVAFLILGMYGLWMSGTWFVNPGFAGYAGYDIFLVFLLLLSSATVLVLAMLLRSMLRRGRQKTVLRILLVCFAVVLFVFGSTWSSDDMYGWAATAFWSFFQPLFILFLVLSALVSSTAEDGQKNDGIGKEILYSTAILFLLLLSWYIFLSKDQCPSVPDVCSDGSRVYPEGPRCELARCPYIPATDDSIRVTSIRPNDIVKSLDKIQGEAEGFWYSDGAFSVDIVDANGETLGFGEARAKEDRITEGFIPFVAVVNYFIAPSTPNGSIIFSSGNAPEDVRIMIPIRF